ncbi:MAG: Wzz/FepE/Etk N-terminal domain-containing protein [Capnocytophaga sp.]|nr:Wzz/FepE/Etk N-terminal domain-containing protein [Capnocytophaga sp.]
MKNNQSTKPNEEIDLIELIRKLWRAKISILKFVILFFILGVLVALFSAKEYTATTVMIPQTSDDKTSANGLGGLAAMAGISLNGASSEAIPLSTYPEIVNSIPFKKKLAQTMLKLEGIDKEISYEQYYHDYVKTGFLDVVKKYTIGLPAVIFGKEEKNDKTQQEGNILSITHKEKKLFENITRQLTLEIDEKKGIITLTYNMPEALAAAQMLQSAQTLLQETITAFKIQKASEELDFIRQRYEESEKNFKAKQFALAQFQDRNRDLFGSLPQTRLQQLQTDYNLAFNVYSELAKQLETKQIKVKEDQPIFIIIEPVSIPNERSKPKRIIIVAIWTLLGIIIGIGSVFAKDFMRQIKQEKTENE